MYVYMHTYKTNTNGLNVFVMCLQRLCLNVKQDESDILSQLFQLLLGDPRALQGQMGCLIPAGKNVKTVRIHCKHS